MALENGPEIEPVAWKRRKNAGGDSVVYSGCIRKVKAIHGVRGVQHHPPWPPLRKGGKGKG